MCVCAAKQIQLLNSPDKKLNILNCCRAPRSRSPALVAVLADAAIESPGTSVCVCARKLRSLFTSILYKYLIADANNNVAPSGKSRADFVLH